MIFEPLFRDLERVARHLPFPLHDIEAANAAFGAWRSEGSEEAKRTVDLWTYCFVRRFALMKFAADRTAPLADFEMLVERMYRRIERKREDISDPQRYTAWVSVVCRNAYYNHLRSGPRLVPLEVDDSVVTVVEPDDPIVETGLVLDALHAAIEQLPPYLRHVAHLRFIENLSYDDVASRSGHDASTCRAYVYKIVKRFRRDGRLIRLLMDAATRSRADTGYT